MWPSSTSTVIKLGSNLIVSSPFAPLISTKPSLTSTFTPSTIGINYLPILDINHPPINRRNR